MEWVPWECEAVKGGVCVCEKKKQNKLGRVGGRLMRKEIFVGVWCVVGNKRVSGARVPIKSDPFFNFFFF